MSKKINIVFSITLVFFILIELLLVKRNSYEMGIMFYMVYAMILYMIDKKYIISLFVYYLPLLPIISTDYKVFGLIGPHEIIYGFSFFVLVQLSKLYNIKRVNSYQKLAINFVYFLFFISVIFIVKDIVLGMQTDKTKGGFYIFKNFIRFFLYYYSLVLLIKIIYQKDIYNFILIGIKTSLITLVLSIIFTVPLALIGAGVKVDDDFFSNISNELNRLAGFYGAGGDVNSLGIFLVSVFAFFLAMYEKMGNIKNYILYFSFAVLGVLMTGSRTAFIALSLVILIFLLTNKSSKSKLSIIVTIILFYFIFYEDINFVLQRFLDPSAVAALDKDQMGRVGKWILYMNWIVDNPETFILGNQTNIDYKRAPHNYLIFLLYHFGIIPLIIFIKLIVNLLSKISMSLNKFTLKNAYYIIPFPLAIMTVNSFGSSIYLWLFLPMGAFFIVKK